MTYILYLSKKNSVDSLVRFNGGRDHVLSGVIEKLCILPLSKVVSATDGGRLDKLQAPIPCRVLCPVRIEVRGAAGKPCFTVYLETVGAVSDNADYKSLCCGFFCRS